MIPIEYLRECFEVDAEAGKLFWKQRPREHFGSDRAWKAFNTAYAGREAFTTTSKFGYHHGCVTLNGKSTFLRRHQVIYWISSGTQAALVDHVNGNCSDDRPINLRAATSKQNRHNSRGWATTSVGVKGVIPRRDKYIARIGVNGKTRHLGVFPTLDEAAAAYAAAAKQHFGEFARID